MSGNGLIALEDQVQRIRALRGRANAAGVNVFINARTDLFLQEPDADRHADLVPSAIARGRAYMKAGASGVFVPGLQDSAAIRTIAEAIEGPLNIMVPANGARVATLRNIGVSRFSYGPVPFLALMETFKTSANAAMSA